VASLAWPYKWRLIGSILCAGAVAALWSATLLLAFPLMKVVLQGQTLHEFVDHEIAIATATASETNELGVNSGRIKLDLLNWTRTHLIPWVPKEAFNAVLALLAALVALTTIKGAVRFIQEVLVASVVERTVVAIRRACYHSVLALDHQTLSLMGTPQLMSRFTYDVDQLSKGLTLVGVKLIREPLKAIACIGCAFAVSWQLTLLSVLLVPVAGIVFYWFGRMLKRASHLLMNSMARIYKVLEETLEAMRVVMAFDGAKRESERFDKVNEEYYGKAMRIAKIDALTSPTMEFIAMLAISVALLPGMYVVLRETTTVWGFPLTDDAFDLAQLAVVYTLLAGVVDPARKLASIYAKVKRASVAAERVFELIDRRPLVQDPPQPVRLPRHHRSIALDNVSFSYLRSAPEAAPRKAALHGVTLKVEAGEFIAVAGASGSGKSSLVSLLPRFYDPDMGVVRIDGIDIRSVSLAELRGQIAIVTQDTMLFDDSIFENIRYGKPDATAQEVEQAASKAHILSFVQQLPDGFETRIGEKGAQLSGGQRQRLALARAILREPAILILDEPTSAVDAESEQLIQIALSDFAKARTTFLVTHSMTPPVLAAATRVAVMDGGQLVAVGRHETLLDSCGIYQRLFESQTHRASA
jgi:subfamily B ATP-binding cassette protein MsbA